MNTITSLIEALAKKTNTDENARAQKDMDAAYASGKNKGEPTPRFEVKVSLDDEGNPCTEVHGWNSAETRDAAHAFIQTASAAGVDLKILDTGNSSGGKHFVCLAPLTKEEIETQREAQTEKIHQALKKCASDQRVKTCHPFVFEPLADGRIRVLAAGKFHSCIGSCVQLENAAEELAADAKALINRAPNGQQRWLPPRISKPQYAAV
jgi:hypothetical protein